MPRASSAMARMAFCEAFWFCMVEPSRSITAVMSGPPALACIAETG